jgi:RHS repeat-associated protein
VVVAATDPSGNTRTNTYELGQAGASTTFTYDANGNLIGDGTKTYEWDANNMLLAVKQGGSTLAAFSYDGSGRRSTKAAGGITTTYVYDGLQFLEERASSAATKRHVYGPGIDHVLARVVNGTASYNVADHLGSVVRTTDSAGAPTLSREYDPWGNLLQGSTTPGYAYTGREWDPEIGLYYYRARSYDARSGRFLAEDSVRDTVSLYVYARNNPLTYGDSLGRSPGQRFRTRDAAVLDAYSTMNDGDIISGGFVDSFEFGGHLCQDTSNGCFFCTGPVSDHLQEKVDVDRAPCPPGTKDKGEYHSHPKGLAWTGMYEADHRRVEMNPISDYVSYIWVVPSTKFAGGFDGRVFRYQKGGRPEGDYVGTITRRR